VKERVYQSSWDPGIKGMGNPSKSKIGFIFHDHHRPSLGPSIIFNFSYCRSKLETFCRFIWKEITCSTFLSANSTMTPVTIDEHLFEKPWEEKMEVLS